MQYAYSVETIRAAEKPLLDAGVPLMAQASYALYGEILQALEARVGPLNSTGDTRAVFLVGAGNNGGDALYAASYLASKPVAVTVILVSSNVHEEALKAVKATQARIVSVAASTITEELIAHVRDADVIVDGLLGLGSQGAPRGVIGEFLEALAFNTPSINPEKGPLIIAVDLPSGVGPDNGNVADPKRVITADITVTIGGIKEGLTTHPANLYAGRLKVADIGLNLPDSDLSILEMKDFQYGGVTAYLTKVPNVYAHKYTRGVIGIIAGSNKYPGAGILTTQAANRSGLGMIRYIGEQNVAHRIVSRFPEIVAARGRVQAWVLGSGMDHMIRTRERLDEVFASGLPAVLDAGALAVLQESDIAKLKPHHVLTPHAGELAEFGARIGLGFTREGVDKDPLSAARTLHNIVGATVVAKGPTTVIAGEDGTYVNYNGTSRLATAGSGDVLAGIIGAAVTRATGFFTEGEFPYNERVAGTETGKPQIRWAQVAAGGVFIHSIAGSIAGGQVTKQWLEESSVLGKIHRGYAHPITASEIAEAIPQAHRLLATGAL